MAEKYLYGPLRGHTVKNTLTNDPHDFFLRVYSRGKYTLRRIAEIVASEGHTNETPERIEESVRLVLHKAMDLTLTGYSIDLEVIRMRSAVKGKFKSPTEPYLQHLHKVKPILLPGPTFTKAAIHTQVINEGQFRGGYIAQVINKATGNINTDITPTYTLELLGMGMRVENNGNLHGELQILDGDTYQVIASIPPEDLLTNEPKKVVFRVPEQVLLPGDTYTVRIKTYMNAKRMPLKEARFVESNILLVATEVE